MKRHKPMNQSSDIRIKSNSSSREKKQRGAFYRQFSQCPIPGDELLRNLGLFINRQTISRMLFFHELYKKIVPVHGIIVEFGVRWGADLALLSSLRGIYEPYNYNRKIVGFDTFSGFPRVSGKDGDDEIIHPGAYGVTPGYDQFLETVLSYHETESPVGHIKKYELVKGDATQTLEKYLGSHPETIIALAYFDFDLYEPTKKCLERIRPHLTKGSVVGFDELNCPDFPGETRAVKDVFGLDRYAIRRLPFHPTPSFIVIE